MSDAVAFHHFEIARRPDGSLHELGRGAMGVTYKAFDTQLGSHVALKVINPTFLNDAHARERFLREARGAAHLNHPNVASVFHLGVDGDTVFYAMQFVEGETLEAFVRRRGPLPPRLALRMVLQAAQGLAAANERRLIHRDIKPANLMLVRLGASGGADDRGASAPVAEEDDDELLVKVIDFGLAKTLVQEDAPGRRAADVSLTGGGPIGTPYFMSPEQIDPAGAAPIDARTDIYSLGVTLWYLLVGKPPFQGTQFQVLSQHISKPPPLEQLAAAGISPPVLALLGRMLAKAPDERPANYRELIPTLKSLLRADHLTAPAAPVTIAPAAAVDPAAQSLSAGRTISNTTVSPPTPAGIPPVSARSAPSRGRGALWLVAAVGLSVLVLGIVLGRMFSGRGGNDNASTPTPAPIPAASPRTQEISSVPSLTPAPPTPGPAATMTADFARSPEPTPTAPMTPPPPVTREPARPQPGVRWENSLGMRFVPVPGAATRGVLFSVWETRVADFAAFVAATGYDTGNGMVTLAADGWKQRGGNWRNPGFPQTSDHPVVGVSWSDANAFCEWLTRKEQSERRLHAGSVYRLPSDLEWSAAVGLPAESGITPRERSGRIKNVYPWGNSWPPPILAGNYRGEESRIGDEPQRWSVLPGYRDSFPRTAPVGLFPANRFGIHDLGGNVWEWCADLFAPGQTNRVLRGASWRNDAESELLSSMRGDGGGRDGQNPTVGFRCVLALASGE